MSSDGKSDRALTILKKDEIRVIRPLSPDELVAFDGAYERLRIYERDSFPFEAVIHNYRDMTTSFEQFAEANRLGRLNNLYGAGVFMMELNRRIMNYLSSVRGFVDHAETRFSRRFGPTSVELESLKARMSKHYDDSFSYRFLYKLRNYAQHCGLPLSNFEVSAVHSEQTGKVDHRVHAYFMRDPLLENYEQWGSQLRSEIAAKPEKWDVLDDLRSVMESVQDIQRHALQFLVPPLLNDVRFVRALRSESSEDGVLCVGSVSPHAPGLMALAMQELPLHIADLVLLEEKAMKED